MVLKKESNQKRWKTHRPKCSSKNRSKAGQKQVKTRSRKKAPKGLKNAERQYLSISLT
jgi:hypothetical protein